MNCTRRSRHELGILTVLALLTQGVAGCGVEAEEYTPEEYSNNSIATTVAARHPFPQHVTYAAGTSKPNHLTQAQLDSSVKAFYGAWKTQYVTKLGTDQYYIHASVWQPGAISVSEGHGYGMLITALMAGADADAQTIYDGMYRFFRAHVGADPQLMGWYQKTQGSSVVNGDPYNATDGDLDIAQSLLLADAQWGSAGTINYLREANTIISAIMQADINRNYWSVMRGSTGQTSQDSRPSDYMLDHFQSFAAASGNANWNKVVDTALSALSYIQQTRSPNTGLIPDFLVSIGSSPAPSPANRFESADDGQYYWNACRVPWRLGASFALSGDQRIATILGKLNSFIRSQTSANPGRISAGYTLSGQPIDQYAAMAFIAPIGVSAMVGTGNQSWLNSLWDRIVATDISAEDYFGNNIKMLAMITMSGNYWAPQALR